METDNLILHKYQVLKKLGKGGFATTYLVKDIITNKEYALKHISLKESESVKNLELLKLEGKVMQQLNHPMIPKLIDFFIEEEDENISVYIIQEYIAGKNLLQAMKAGKQFYEKSALKIALNITKLLEYLNSFSPPIIHRDIKPENIIITEDEKVYLIDFGAVKEKIMNNRISKLGVSTIIGTQGYMPIEQFEGRTVPSSDIYALGLTLIHLLSRKDIYKIDKDGLKLCFRPHVDITEEFALVLDKMIEPDYKKRYQTASELKESLVSLFDKSSNKRKQKINLELIKQEITETEKLRWFGPSDISYARNRLILVNGFIFILFLFSTYMITPELVHSFLSIIIHLYIFLCISLLSSYLINQNTNKMLYAITDKRVLVIKRGTVKVVNSYSSIDLENMIISINSNLYGSTNFVFTRKGYRKEDLLIANISPTTPFRFSYNTGEKQFEITGVKNAKLIKSILADILAINKNQDQINE